MAQAIVWWFMVQLLGFIALPFTSVIFRGLPDRGYAFGKALAILLVSYILWLAASAHILPNSQWSIILIIVLLAAGSFFLFMRRRHEIASFVSENRGVIIATEAIFLVSFILYAVVHSYNAEIAYTEKPMDFAFLNAILRSDYFPPNDPWLSGHSLNNYYFGHLMMATLTKLSGISSAITFNLSLTLIFALAAIGAFGIVYNLVRLSRGGFRAALGFGVIAVGFLLIAGNLEGVLELLHANCIGGEGFWKWVGISGLDHSCTSTHWYPTDWWWWWRASRVITPVDGIDTITEFPFFSFLLGDLHAHLLSLPFVLLSLAITLNILTSKEPLGFVWLRKRPLVFVAMIVCLGSLGPLHTWDLPVYIFIFLGAVLIQTYMRRADTGHRWWWEWIAISFISIAGIFLFYVPFYVNMQSPVTGVFPWRGQDTRLFHYFIIWGLFLFIGISFVLFQIRCRLRSLSWRSIIFVSLAVLSLWAIWAIVVLVIGGGHIWGKLGHLAPMLILLVLTLWVIVQKVRRTRVVAGSATFALLLLFTALLLTIGCELFYVEDSFFVRMNTFFRLYYAAWVLFALASAFGLYYLWRHWRTSTKFGRVVKASWWVFLVILVVAAFIYPVAATSNRTSAFGGSPTLDGLAFFERSNPSDMEAIAWLSSNVKGAPVIVEAVGGDYTTYGRVSGITGLPTILGWEQHEWIWRGSDRDLKGRRDDVNLIYVSSDLNQVKSLLEKYNVTFVYVGTLERASYGPDVGGSFESCMNVAFSNEGVTIFKVKE
jgi:YYY domain-containing protein